MNRRNFFLRGILVAALFGWLFHVAYAAPLLAVLIYGNHTWFMPLESAPIWSEPPRLNYDEFSSVFDTVPPRDTPDVTIGARPDYSNALIYAILGLWPISLIAGILSLVVAKTQPDSWLRASLGIGIGITCGALLCFAFYTIVGGWSPPYPAEFALIGAVGGGIASVCWRRSRPSPSQTT